ncbi:hypothetical protein [Aeromonas hydrophila]|uniref:hypothetical protein n=1 Tax=Aeromonas hydrophila TaxID=644 RepID=UPI002B47AEBA|nr:hypothetical protein [Aeromonas hydrophila]
MAPNDKKNDSKPQSWNDPKVIIVSILGVLFCVFLVNFLFFSEEDDSFEATESAHVEQVGSGPQATTDKPGVIVATEAQKQNLIRMVTAPQYNDIYAAAQIIKQAQDQTEAKDFVSMRSSLRAIRIKEEASKLLANDAENRVKKAKMERQMKFLETQKSGSPDDLGLEPSEGEVVASNSNGYPRMPANVNSVGANNPLGSTQSSPVNDEDTKLAVRIAGFTTTGRLTLQSGNEFEPNAKVGQTVFGRYRIEDVNLALRCITLVDEKYKRTVPKVCYTG